MKIKSLILFLTLSLIVEAQYKEVYNALNNYEYEIGIKLIEKESENNELNYLKAKCYKNLSQYSKAIIILEELIAQDSINISILTELANCYQLNGNYKKSKSNYAKALRISPSNQFLQLNYVDILYKLKNWEETIHQIQQVFQKDTLSVLYPVLGDCYWQLDKKDSAKLYYKKGLIANPEDYNTVSKLSRLYLQGSNYYNLIDCTNKYMLLDSTNQTINQYNGIGHCFIKNYDRAIFRLSKLYSEGDSSFTTNYYLGASYFALQNYYSAYEHLTKAYQNDSTNLNLIYYYGRSAILIGKFNIGIGVLNRGVDLVIPKDSVLYNFYSNLALGYARSKKYELAIQNYELSYKYNSKNRTLLYTIAGIYDNNLKNSKQAMKYYKLFLATFPKEPEISKEEFNDELSGTYYSAVKNRIEELKTEEFFKKE